MHFVTQTGLSTDLAAAVKRLQAFNIKQRFEEKNVDAWKIDAIPEVLKKWLRDCH